MRRDTEPNEPSGDALEAMLRSASDAMEYPPTPRVARRVRDRLERRPTASLSGWRRWVGWWRTDGAGSPSAGRPVARWAWSGAAVAALAVVLVGWRLVLPAANQPTAGAMLQPPAAAPAARTEAGRQEPQSENQVTNDSRAAAPATAEPRQGGGVAANGPGGPADQAAAASAGAAGGTAAVPSERFAAAPPAAPSPLTGAGSRMAPAAPAARPGALDTSSPRRSGGSGAALTDAAARLGFVPLGPALLGTPTAVSVVDEGTGSRLVLSWDARPAGPEGQEALPTIVLTEGVGGSDPDGASGGETVVWPDGRGTWQAHAADAGGTLMWTSGGIAFRLESSLPADRAADLAAALAPLLP